MKRKFEWAKFVCGMLVVYAILCGVAYYIAIFMDKSPDSALAVQSCITLLGGYLSYCLYQFGLKNSRNKYSIDENGQPYKEKSGEER